MAFVSGPRQVGKTTLGRQILTSPVNEFNWDDQRFRRRWVKDQLNTVESRGPGPILLDEIHKDRHWKSRLKGHEMPIVVAGSARLDLFRRGGDSMMGRYLPYRLHPFSVGEREEPPAPDTILSVRRPTFAFADLLKLGGFPEPLLKGSEAKAQRWSRLRLERLLYEDVRDLRHVRDLQALRILVDLLPERVGSLLSMDSLRHDVGVAYATVHDWIAMLETLYHIFTIRPYAGRLKRTLKAQPKLYLYDILQLETPGARRENLAALHLLKACHYWTDAAHGVYELRFLRTKDGAEVDFVVVRNRRPWMLVECRSDDAGPSKALVEFAARLKTEFNTQLVERPEYDRLYPELDVRVTDYERFLAGLP